MNPLIEGMPVQNNSVSESGLNFSYELPNTAPDPDFDKEANATIDEIARAFGKEPPEGEPQELEGDAETPTDDSAPQEPKLDEPEPDDEDPKFARGLERLTARELKAREEEAKAQATWAAVKAEKAELQALKGLKSSKDLADLMESDPIAAFEAMGKNPDEIIRRAMAVSLEKAGQEVPEGLKKYLAESATNRRIQALEKKNAELEQSQAAANYYRKVDGECLEYVKKVDVKKYSTVANAVKADPGFVHREVMEEIVRDSQIRAASDPDGDPMSFEQAVANVEARWAKLRTLFGSGPIGSQGKQIAQPGKLTPPQPKPAAAPASRPIAPWLQKPKDIYEDGIQEAMREYERVEAERKRGAR